MCRSIRRIFEQHPNWDRGSRRLETTLDHVNPRSWRGNVDASADLDIPSLWKQGAAQAKELAVEMGDLAAEDPDLNWLELAQLEVDIRRPYGGIVGITLQPGICYDVVACMAWLLRLGARLVAVHSSCSRAPYC
jgi:hypothetical protein